MATSAQMQQQQVRVFSALFLMLFVVVVARTQAAVVVEAPAVAPVAAAKPAPAKAPAAVILPPAVAPVVAEAPKVAPVVAAAPKTPVPPVLPPAVTATAPAKTAPVPTTSPPLAAAGPAVAATPAAAAGPAGAVTGALPAAQLTALKHMGMAVGANACAVEPVTVLTCDPTSHELKTLSVHNCPPTAALSPVEFKALATASLTQLSISDCSTVDAPAEAPPVEFANSLQDLFLMDSFTKVLGWWLGRLHALKNLTVIDVGVTTDSGLEVIISKMVSLEYLTLSNASLPGKLPTLWPLGLVSIQLVSNAISGGIPSAMGSLTKLTKLDLSNNNLNGSIPSELGKLPLTYVDFSNNTALSGLLPFSTAALASMKTLKVGGTAICYDPTLSSAKLAHSFAIPPCGGMAPIGGPISGPSSSPTPGSTPIVAKATTHKKKPKLIVVVIAAAAALVVLSAIIYCCCRWWGAREGYA